MALSNTPNKLSASRTRPSWRRYQQQLHRDGRWRFIPRKHLVGLAVFVLTAAVWWIFANPWPDSDNRSTRLPPEPADTAPPLFSKADVRNLLAEYSFEDIRGGPFNVAFGERKLQVESTLDVNLQDYLQGKLYRRTSRYIAIVVLDAQQGQVRAMVNFAKEGRAPNPSLASDFPAASLFKIVTAAAALEKCGYSSQTPLAFNGASHTLYKSQLKNVRNRYTRQTTLEKAFAGSVNPVFGKIGRHCLGREKLQGYADRFGFNQPIPFELALRPSRTTITDEPYQWAEISSGFNQQTMISPLHGAMLAAVVPAEGRLVEPTIIRRITDQNGVDLYHPQFTSARAVSPHTARELSRLMRRTVSHGTARKIFRRMRRDKVLSQLTIGGKTGSIDTRDHGARYDWFVGFADGPEQADAIAVAVLVAHEKFIGRRAGEYARLAMREYYRLRAERRSKATSANPSLKESP
ncbi:MAG: penicillin-binding transpeptidase domain-containing protein [Desulfobacterales bacterium]